jgi:hypothetical protein
VARNAPPIEVSADFSARLAARIAEERRLRIAQHAPSRAERSTWVSAGQLVWARRAAAVAAVVGGSMVVRSAVLRAGVGASVGATASLSGTDSVSFITPAPVTITRAAALPSFEGSGEIVVVSAMRPVGGAILADSDDPMLDGAGQAGIGNARSATVAATAPLWPTAQMAAYAANRFAAMEFGDVAPVSVMHTQR